MTWLHVMFYQNIKYKHSYFPDIDLSPCDSMDFIISMWEIFQQCREVCGYLCIALSLHY